MPNWKKIALSGSSPEFSSIDVDNSISAGSLTGSIHFNNLTDSPTLLSSSAQIASDITGSFTSTSASIASNIASLVTDSGSFSTRVTAVEGFSSSIESSIYSYTGSFTGDGSGLTGVTTNLTEEVTVSQTFTSATTASVNHLFGTKDILVTVYDDNDDQFIPSRVNTPDNNNVNIYMDPATTGRVVVAKGGHLVSGSIHKHLMTSVTSSTITHNLQEEFPVVQVYESASREMFIPETIKSIDANNTQVVLSELIDCYVVIKR